MLKGLEQQEQRVKELSNDKYVPIVEGARTRPKVTCRGDYSEMVIGEETYHWESGYKRLPNGDVKHIHDILYPWLEGETVVNDI